MTVEQRFVIFKKEDDNEPNSRLEWDKSWVRLELIQIKALHDWIIKVSNDR